MSDFYSRRMMREEVPINARNGPSAEFVEGCHNPQGPTCKSAIIHKIIACRSHIHSLPQKPSVHDQCHGSWGTVIEGSFPLAPVPSVTSSCMSFPGYRQPLWPCASSAPTWNALFSSSLPTSGPFSECLVDLVQMSTWPLEPSPGPSPTPGRTHGSCFLPIAQ